MESIQDLGKFDNKVLGQMIWSAFVSGDKKAWRKFCEETERRRRTQDAPDVATVCPKCNYMAKYPLCVRCGTHIPATQVI